MHFLPGADEAEAMCEALGIDDPDELYRDVDPGFQEPLDIPASADEQTVRREIAEALEETEPFDETPHFLGGGAEPHYVPAVVTEMLKRGEFLTSYTPYQPEINQGFLQAMWEYQTYLCRLTDLEVANISMYDGPTSVGEAALLAVRATRGDAFVVPEHLRKDTRSVVENYLGGLDVELRTVPFDRETGTLDHDALQETLQGDEAGVYLENPNLFGCWEDGPAVGDIVDDQAPDALYVVGVHPHSLALVDGPGAYGADVAVGEGQPLGQAPSFGGPGLGLLACTEDLLRKTPGRIVGQTVDEEGRRAYTLALQTREQHIRRERATSNICTNEGMNALAATVYLAALGGKGLRRVAETMAKRSRDLAGDLEAVDGVEAPAFSADHFHEFVARVEPGVDALDEAARDRGILTGIDFSDRFPDLGEVVHLCVTESHPDWALEALVEAAQEVAR
jgi:glycine dehydrogenase subunit 1